MRKVHDVNPTHRYPQHLQHGLGSNLEVGWSLKFEIPVEGHMPDESIPVEGIDVWDDKVYLRIGHMVVALTTNGSSIWRFETNGDIKTVPIATGDTVYFGSEDGHVYALDADSGDEKWRFNIGTKGKSSPVVVDDTVYIGNRKGEIYALDADTGAERWCFEAFSFVGTPSVMNGTVYVHSLDPNKQCGQFHALDATNGTKKWCFEADEMFSKSTVVDNTIYIGSSGYGSTQLFVLDADTGEEKWQFEMEGDNRKTVTLPAVMNDTVYIGGSGMNEGTLYAIDATNGSEKWHFNKDSKISSPPVAVDEVVCIGFEDKNLYALDTVFGSEKWRYEAGGKIDYCLPVSGTIYLGSHAGEIIALSGDKSQPETGTKTSSPSRSKYDDNEHFYDP